MRSVLGPLIWLLALVNGSPVHGADTSSAGAPGSATVAAAHITYFARAGDTLSSIAQMLTTGPENWTELGKLNHITQESRIPIGAAIIIPAELLADEPADATVIARSGNVLAIKPDGTTLRIGVGARLGEGVQLETSGNSFVTLALPDASRIALPSNTRVKLAKLRLTLFTNSPRTEILLLRGKVESHVAPLDPKRGSFEIRTSHSVAGVRGTDFRVGVSAAGIATEVLSGKVAVGNSNNPATAALDAGFGNFIDATAVGAAVKLLPAPQFAGGAQKVQPAAQIRLAALAGAHAYHTQIATDADALNVIAENISTDSNVKLDPLPDGDYFVRISALDQHGLEGFSRIGPATLKNAVQTSLKRTPAPSVVNFDQKAITLRWSGQRGATYVLQVARDASFSWLLFSTRTDTAQARMPRPDFGTYYARVQAVAADGRAGGFSATQAFIVTDQWVMNDGTPADIQQTPSVSPR